MIDEKLASKNIMNHYCFPFLQQPNVNPPTTFVTDEKERKKKSEM